MKRSAWIGAQVARLRGKGGPGQAGALRGGGRRCAPTALRFSISRPAAVTSICLSLNAMPLPRRYQ